MRHVELPNFGELLAPILASVSGPSRPGMLARLERGAAQRYREWAESESAQSFALLACAEREEEIARTVDGLFPLEDEQAARVDAAVPEARELYYGVFDGCDVVDQWRIQASAERQGAMAWRDLAKVQPEDAVRAELERCAELEEASAAVLDELIARRTG